MLEISDSLFEVLILNWTGESSNYFSEMLAESDCFANLQSFLAIIVSLASHSDINLLSLTYFYDDSAEPFLYLSTCIFLNLNYSSNCRLF